MLMAQDESLQAVARRLKRLRLMAGLNRAQLAELAGAGVTSISIWENAAGNAMTDKSADKIISALKERGVTCSKEWLLKGSGTDPQVTLTKQGTIAANIEQAAEQVIGQLSPQTIVALQEEIKLFAHSNPLAVIIKVEHDGMKPFIQKGDVVGGIWQQVARTQFNADEICILEMDGKLDIRNIRSGTKEGLFHVSYISYNSNLIAPFSLQDALLTRIAPLKRLWRL